MIRRAEPRDIQAILLLIQELAEYEKLSHQLETSAERLQTDLFGPEPKCQALVALESEESTAIVGYAFYYRSYSTFRTRVAMFLEDLYVTPSARGRGHGRVLLAAVAAAATAQGCPRLDWNVLAWNELAISFYQGLGAGILPDWRVCRLEGDALGRLARGAGRL